jgi:hypothetical protein
MGIIMHTGAGRHLPAGPYLKSGAAASRPGRTVLRGRRRSRLRPLTASYAGDGAAVPARERSSLP